MRRRHSTTIPRLLLQRFGKERLKMGCSMHATAQALVRASVFEVRPTVTSAELRKALSSDFMEVISHEATAKILFALGPETLAG
jgi:hypothetical protein